MSILLKEVINWSCMNHSPESGLQTYFKFASITWNMSFFENVIWWQGQVIFIAWWPMLAAVSSMQCHDALLLKKCLFFCRHFFSTRLKNYAPSGCGASRPWIRRRRAAWKLLLRAPSLVRRVNNKQKPHCCLSAQGLRECRHVVAVMALYAYPSSFPASSIPLTFHRPFSSPP